MMLTTWELQRIVQEQGHACMTEGQDTLIVPIVDNERTLEITATISHDGTYLRWYVHLGCYGPNPRDQAILMQRLMEENGDAGLVHYAADPENRTIGAQVSMLVSGSGLTGTEVRHCLVSLVCAADLLDDPEVGRLIQGPLDRLGQYGGPPGATFSDGLCMAELRRSYRPDGSPIDRSEEQA